MEVERWGGTSQNKHGGRECVCVCMEGGTCLVCYQQHPLPPPPSLPLPPAAAAAALSHQFVVSQLFSSLHFLRLRVWMHPSIHPSKLVFSAPSYCLMPHCFPCELSELHHCRGCCTCSIHCSLQRSLLCCSVSDKDENKVFCDSHALSGLVADPVLGAAALFADGCRGEKSRDNNNLSASVKPRPRHILRRRAHGGVINV